MPKTTVPRDIKHMTPAQIAEYLTEVLPNEKHGDFVAAYIRKLRQRCVDALNNAALEQIAEYLTEVFTNEKHGDFVAAYIKSLWKRRNVGGNIPRDGKAYLDLQICFKLLEVERLFRYEEDRYVITRKSDNSSG